MNGQVKNQTIAPGIDKVPMAVYPLNSSAKLDQEPNPFEQSFSGVTTIEEKKENKLTLPPVAAITSPSPILNATTTTTTTTINNNTSNPSVIGGGILPKEVTNQFTWDTLRTGPLSPSMLQGPIQSNVTPKTYTNYPIKIEQETTPLRSRQPSNQSQSRKRSVSTDSDEKKTKKKNDTEDDEKRKNFLERNRIAALKCRQRKKQWLNNLQAKVEFLTSDNERLQLQSEALKQEIVNLKTLLLAHKDCPVAQANGFNVNSIHKGMLLSNDTFSTNSTPSSTTSFQPPPTTTTKPIMSNGTSVIRF